MKKKLAAMTGVVAVVAVVVMGTASPALAAVDYRDCPNNWSYTSATASTSVTHYHEVGGFWRSVNRSAGYSNFKGWYKPGPVWMEINSSGTVSSPYFGCSA